MYHYRYCSANRWAALKQSWFPFDLSLSEMSCECPKGQKDIIFRKTLCLVQPFNFQFLHFLPSSFFCQDQYSFYFCKYQDGRISCRSGGRHRETYGRDVDPETWMQRVFRATAAGWSHGGLAVSSVTYNHLLIKHIKSSRQLRRWEKGKTKSEYLMDSLTQ